MRPPGPPTGKSSGNAVVVCSVVVVARYKVCVICWGFQDFSFSFPLPFSLLSRPGLPFSLQVPKCGLYDGMHDWAKPALLRAQALCRAVAFLYITV